MTKYRTFQTSFTAGEFDQLMRDRTDVRSFFEGAQKMRNFALLAQGGFTRRPGTLYRTALNSGNRIIPFEYSANDALIINLYTGKLKVYDLLGNEVAFISDAPWVTSELFEIKYVQQGNGVVLSHQNWPPQLLVRDPEDNSFTLSEWEYFENADGISARPFSAANNSGVYEFTVSDIIVGSVTLTCNRNYFTTDHIGVHVRLEEGYGIITAYTNRKTVTMNQIKPPTRTLTANPVRIVNAKDNVRTFMADHRMKVGDTFVVDNFVGFANMSSNGHNQEQTVAVVVDQDYIEYNPPGDQATEDGVGGGSTMTVTWRGPTANYREQSFSEINGYPGACGVHEERMWFGGTKKEPDTIWGSVTANFNDFTVGRNPSDAIQVTINSGSVNEIRHIVSSRHLQVLTNQNEFYIPASENAPVTPETVAIRKQTPFGSSHARASLFDGATLFVQENGRSVREFLYTDREFAYNARNIALIAQHLVEQPIELSTIYGSTIRPEQYAFLLNATGELTVLHSIRSEEMVGWAQWETDGLFNGIAVAGQRVFVSVERNGVVSLEEFDLTFEHFMDGVIGFQSPDPTNLWGGALEYANQEVAVTADNYFLGYVQVDADGNFVTDSEHTSCEIGINYKSEAETMRVAFPLPDGPIQGVPLRITRCVVDFGESTSMNIDGQRLILRNTIDFPPDHPDPMDQSVEFWINKVDRAPSITFTQDVPLEATIYSCMIEVSF